ncbi:hypothetical protein BpHYR1_052708 [Brachionus plicatilis]|uniref:Uncharacterized protein n=1 Tax=Brachionus plicatilis TaxID=10195 RepID=A0A3M7SKM3_BRAPC|nr:hypothetical protein BpHYR1_052708 [Brachionus plicatilis]
MIVILTWIAVPDSYCSGLLNKTQKAPNNCVIKFQILTYISIEFKLNNFRECNMVQHSKLHLLSKSANDVQNLCKMHYARTY